MDEIPLAGRAPGALWNASFTDVGPDPDAALAEAGADILVSLVQPEEIELRGFTHFAGWMAAHPERVRCHPIPDWGTIEDEEVLDIVEQLADLVLGGHKLVLHCGAGMGRTGVLSTLVLVHLGMAYEDAAVHVRAHRAGAGPDSEHQRVQLERLAARIAADHA